MTDLNELLKQTSRSLYLSARLLPHAVREAFCIAYLLCRYADTIADTSLLPAKKRLQWVQLFPSMITHLDPQQLVQLTREIAPSTTNIYEAQLLHHLPDCIHEFEKLSQAQQQTILEVVHAVCRGMEIDLQTFPDENSGQVKAFSSNAELENYCHLMGGAPGVFWSILIAETVAIKIEKKQFISLGKKIGDALQLVNILRDLPKDLRIGRCYFAQEQLQQHHLSPADLLNKQNNEQFEPIKQKWISWGRKKLEAAYIYFAAIPKTQIRHRAAVAWPVLWAADTLQKLSQEKNLLDPAVHVKIPRRFIYGTMLATPPVLVSNSLFNNWLKSKLSDGK